MDLCLLGIFFLTQCPVQGFSVVTLVSNNYRYFKLTLFSAKKTTDFSYLSDLLANVHVCVFICVCLCVCSCVWGFMCVCSCVYTCIYTCERTSVGTGHTKTKFSSQRRLICQRDKGKGIRDKDRKERTRGR